MLGLKPQSGRRACDQPLRSVRRAVIVVLLLLAVPSAAAPPSSATSGAPPYDGGRLAPVDAAPAPSDEAPALFGVPTALGTVDYHPGRGLHVGDTGLTVGGFTTAFGEFLEGGDRDGGLDSVNFLISYRPVSFVHLFSELEWSEPVLFERGSEPHVGGDFAVDRLYVDLGESDAVNLRVGQFLTPIGRWNLAPADPLVWTTSEPLLVEQVFDDTVKGAMLWGTLFPRDQVLSYALYGTFFPAPTPDPDAEEPDHVAGARLEWTGIGGTSVGVSYSASQRRSGEPWRSLGGFDALWRPHERVELTTEALFGEGPRIDGSLWGIFGQAVVETVPTLYAVGRYEHFDQKRERAVNLFDLGLTWVPRYYLRFKVDYQFADHVDDRSPPGLRCSFSVLF